MSHAEEVSLDQLSSFVKIDRFKVEDGKRSRIAVPRLKFFKVRRWFVKDLGYVTAPPTASEIKSHPLENIPKGHPLDNDEHRPKLQVRVATAVVEYYTNKEGKPVTKELAYDVKIWDMTEKKAAKLRGPAERANAAAGTEDPKILEKIDLLVTCEDQKWQNMSLDPAAGKALWLADEEKVLDELEAVYQQIPEQLSREVSVEDVQRHLDQMAAESVEGGAEEAPAQSSHDVSQLLEELGV